MNKYHNKIVSYGKLTANSGRGGVSWQGVESFPAVTIESNISLNRWIANIFTPWNDQEVVVAIGRSKLTLID